MNENENISEPTCEGKWYRGSAGFRDTVQVVKRLRGVMKFQSLPGVWVECKCPGITWTGPIPVSEKEPALSEDMHPFVEIHRKSHDCPLPPEPDTRSVADDSADNQKVLSENERRKWGRLFHSAEPYLQRFPYDDMHTERQKAWNEAAIRFRAECIAPYEQLAEFVSSIVHASTSEPVTEEELTTLHELYDNLPTPARSPIPAQPPPASTPPGQDEPSAEKKRVGDEELGRLALEAVASEVGRLSSSAVCLRTAPIGAIIRAKIEGKS